MGLFALLSGFLFCVLAGAANLCAAETSEPLDRIWLTLSDEKARTVTVSWLSPESGVSTVFFGCDETCPTQALQPQETIVAGSVNLNFVQIPMPEETGEDSRCFYRLETRTPDGRTFRSALHSFQPLSARELRLAFVGNVHAQVIPPSVAAQKPHLLCLTGDLVPRLWEDGMTREEARENLKPYCQLVERNRDLFASVLLMPVPGNHDREIAPRGERISGPSESYDVEASAFCRFFALPESRWKWFLDWEPLSLRLVGLDLNHISDFGTSLQTCHAWQKDSEQFQWFDRVSQCEKEFLITFQNERCATVRSAESGAWQTLLARGTLLVAGFGHYAERAEADGLTCFNTSLYGRGAKYPDPKKTFFASTDNFLLLTLTPGRLLCELRDTNSADVLDRSVREMPR